MRTPSAKDRSAYAPNSFASSERLIVHQRIGVQIAQGGQASFKVAGVPGCLHSMPVSVHSIFCKTARVSGMQTPEPFGAEVPVFFSHA